MTELNMSARQVDILRPTFRCSLTNKINTLISKIDLTWAVVVATKIYKKRC